MKFKFLLLTALLMFVVLAGLLFYKSSGLIYDIEDEILNYLEDNYQIKIDVQEKTLWPINKIVLRGVSITSVKDQFSIKVPEISIYYDLFSFLTTAGDSGSIIDFISLDKPSIKIMDSLNKQSKFISYNGLSKDIMEKKVLEILNRLYLTAPFQIRVEDGELLYANKKNKFQLEKLNLLFKVVNKDECRIQLDTAVYTDRLKWNQYEIKKSSLNDLKIVMLVNKDSWQGNIETNYIGLPDFSKHLIEDLLMKSNSLIDYENIDGLIKSQIFFKGRGLSLEEYNGVFSVKKGQGDFTINSDRKASTFLDKFIENERFRLEDIKGEINYNSNKKKISTNQIEFKLNDNMFKVNGRLELLSANGVDVFGHLRTKQLDITKLEFLPEEFNIDGSMVMDLTVAGLLSDLNMNLDLSLSVGKVNDIKIENMVSSLRYYQGNAYLDQLNFVLNETNQFTMSGVLNKESKEYSFNIEGRDVDINLLNKFTYLDGILGKSYSDLSGIVNLAASVTGKDLGLEGLNASGQFEVIEPTINFVKAEKKEIEIDKEVDLEQGVKFTRLSSEFYLSDKRILLHQGIALADWGEIAFSGELGLNNKNLRIKIDSEYISIGDFLANLGSDKLNQFTEKDLTGEVKLDGYIEGKISSPLITADISSPDGSFKGYRYDDFTADLNYSNKMLSIRDLSFNYHQSLVKGQALVDFTAGQIMLDGNLYTEGFSYDLFSDILRQENMMETPLPVDGNIGIKLSLNGPLFNPDIFLQAHSTDTSLTLNDNKLAVDEIGLIAEIVNREFVIENIIVTKGDASITADGVVSRGLLDIEYKFDSLPLKYIYKNININNKQVEGNINLVGNIRGTLEKPIVNGMITVNNTKYQQDPIGTLNGELKYFDNKLKLNSITWKNGQKEYIIDGEINNILSQPNLDLSLKTEKGHLQDFAFLGLNKEIENFALHKYYFVGEALFKGHLNDIYTWLDFDIINSNNSSDNIQLLGSIGSDIDLSIHGKGVTIDKFLAKYTTADVRGELEFNGELTGSINSFDLFLDTRISNAVLGEISIEDVQGKLEINKGSILSFNQKVLFSSNKSLDLKGSFPFKKGLNGLDLNLQLKEFPLQFLSIYNTSWPQMAGFLTGDLDLSGGLYNPTLDGKLNINNASLDLGLPDKFTHLIGDVLLTGRQVKLPGLSGRYGGGRVLIKGLVEPFSNKENWDLVLRGKDLPFDYGSFDGQFDPDMTITGSFKVPFIEADLLAHDFDVGMPFRWPKSSMGRELKFDFNLYPGDEVYLVSKNINVLIQDGSLNINNLDDKIVFSGELSSKQGSFDFYNNKFILEEGSALFERRFDEENEFIPEMDISAWTNVGGTSIEVQLTGRANNMVTTFQSSPHLEQDEILTLLTSRGGIGEFASGDLDNVVRSELYRMLYNQLQLDVVKNIQEELKKALELDRLEVDAYNLGWNNQLSIYLGKHLNKRLYLEYTDIVINDDNDLVSDKQGELSLQYLIDENITFETSWLGEENYSLGIETNLEF